MSNHEQPLVHCARDAGLKISIARRSEALIAGGLTWAFLLVVILFGAPVEVSADVGSDLRPGEWAVVSLNTIEDVDPCPARDCSYSAVEGVAAVINDWCGGVFASHFGTLGGLVAWGGGHNGYFGSEIYVFDLGSQLWVRHTDPYDDGSESVAARCSAEGIYPDGSACPTHTYNAIEYHPGTNRLVILIGTPDPVMGGAVDGRAHLFNFTTNTWELGAVNPNSFSYDAPGAYDAGRDIYWQLYGYVYHLASYDPNLDQWQDYGSPGVYDIDGAGKVDPVRDLFVFIDGRGSGRMYAIPLDSPTTPFVELRTGGDVEIQSFGALGFEWEPVTQRFVAWHDGADVYVLTPPAGDWSADTWSWARVPPAAGNTAVPTANSNGTYGRFRYASTINAFLLVSATDGPVWAYKLDSGGGPDPDPDDAAEDAGPRDAVAEAEGAGEADIDAAADSGLDGDQSSDGEPSGGCGCRV